MIATLEIVERDKSEMIGCTPPFIVFGNDDHVTDEVIDEAYTMEEAQQIVKEKTSILKDSGHKVLLLRSDGHYDRL